MRPVGAEKLLELEIESKAYRSGESVPAEVLRGIVVGLAAGEFVSLFGPSGCGKTSILRIAAGIDRDFRGRRWIAPSARIGMVFQEPRLLAWRTVEANVQLAMDAAAVSGDIGDWLERFDLTAQRQKFAGELSLGQARRVALVRALSIRPSVLLLDEPFVSLDEAIATRSRRELRAMAETGEVGVLMVTHDLHEAIELSDRLLFMDGRSKHFVLEKDIAVCGGQRDKVTVATMAAELTALVGRPN